MKRPHTPTPWYLGSMLVDPGEDGWDGTIQAGPTEEDKRNDPDPEPFQVAEVTDEADAALIVRAVNAHAALLAACEEALFYADSDGLKNRLRAALTLAKGT